MAWRSYVASSPKGNFSRVASTVNNSLEAKKVVNSIVNFLEVQVIATETLENVVDVTDHND